MLGKPMLWVRRNTRKAVALAIAPGLLLLAVDAWIGHFAGGRGESQIQSAPIVYGVLGMLALLVAALPRSFRPFAVVARAVGVLGVLVGVGGTALHVKATVKLLEGDLSWSNVQSVLPDAPPIFAPLAFAGIGAIVYVLASRKLLLRARVGRPETASATVVPLSSEERAKKAS